MGVTPCVKLMVVDAALGLAVLATLSRGAPCPSGAPKHLAMGTCRSAQRRCREGGGCFGRRAPRFARQAWGELASMARESARGARKSDQHASALEGSLVVGRRACGAEGLASPPGGGGGLGIRLYEIVPGRWLTLRRDQTASH